MTETKTDACSPRQVSSFNHVEVGQTCRGMDIGSVIARLEDEIARKTVYLSQLKELRGNQVGEPNSKDDSEYGILREIVE
jgi:hypothetical protein